MSLFSSRTRFATALLVLLALVLTACSGDELPDDPQQAVVEAFQNRVDEGFTASLGLELSESARQLLREEDPETADQALEFLDGDFLTITSDDGQFGLAVAIGDGQPIQIRKLEDALYFLVDAPTLVEEFGGQQSDLEEFRAQLPQLGMFVGDLLPLIEAALDGNWAGITDIPEDAGEQLEEAGGGVLGTTPTEGETESEIAEELGFTDPAVFAERYLEVTEAEEGRYEATLLARKLVQAAQEASGELGAVAGGDLDPAQTPERVEGVVIETADGVVSSLQFDVVRLVSSLGEEGEVEGLGPGDIQLTITFSDVDGSLLEAPDDAVTVDFQTVLDLIERLAGLAESFLGGMGGGAPAPAQTAPEEFPTDLPTDLPTDFPTDFPTEAPTG